MFDKKGCDVFYTLTQLGKGLILKNHFLEKGCSATRLKNNVCWKFFFGKGLQRFLPDLNIFPKKIFFGKGL